MKILFIATKPMPDNMEYHVIETLEDMGHQVINFDIKTIFGANRRLNAYAEYIAGFLLREPERIHEKKLLDLAAKENPDLVLVLLGNMVSPKTISLLKKCIKAPIVCWCQDTLATIGRQYLIGSPYDLVFLKDHYMVNLFNDMVGDRFRYLPEACNPRMHYFEPPSAAEKDIYACDITTAASLYYYRQEILKPLQGEFKLKVWGDVPDWLNYELGSSHTRRYVVDRHKRHAFSAAKIVLNTLYFAEVDAVNCRLFEIAGCGGFQLVSEKAEVSRHFEIGEEIEVFRNKNELIEKVNYYLREPEKRIDIAKKGLARAHREHTYKHRLTELLRISST